MKRNLQAPTGEHERLASALEMTIRERLALRIGRGPITNRVAHLLARARLLENAAAALRDELQRLDDRGRITAVARAGTVASECRAEIDRLREAALRLEARQVQAPDEERYRELAREVENLEAADRVRALANEITQAVGRIGPRGLEALWAELERVARDRDLPLDEDLPRRFQEVIEAAERGREHSGSSASWQAPADLTPPRLLRAADDLFERAGSLESDDLRDRIESIAGRLKALQELSDLDRRDREIVRKAFGVLTRIGKEHRPGWTPLLDSSRRGKPWMEYAEAADARIAARAERRERERKKAKEDQRREALERFRAHERQLVHGEAVERLKAALYHFERVRAVPGAEDVVASAVREARVQAAIALQSAAGEDEVQSVAAALDQHRELVARGRAFRALRRLWGEEPAGQDTGTGEHREAEEEPESWEVEEAVSGLDRPWGENILECHGAGEGERLLMVGGLPGQRRKQMLRDFFGWDQLEWHESYRDRQADFKTLRQRIAQGRFDRVIVLARFCGHDVHFGLRDACRAHDVSYHVHPRGASIPAIATFVYGA